jgi:ligand-binding SRPBCC domain-containing protein
MRAVAGVRAGPLRLGDTVTWQGWHFGVPWRMTSEIVEVDRPHCFADQMLRGPFARWHHVHTFQRTANGSRITDDVEYDTPLGVLGRLFDAVVLERYMKRLLTGRNRRFKRTVETVYRAQRRGA